VVSESLLHTRRDDFFNSLLKRSRGWFSQVRRGPKDQGRSHDQAAFRVVLRRLYDRIKARHGEAAIIHLFPALPASLAMEVGRVWMPKSDLLLRPYDNHRASGFIPAFEMTN